MKISEELAAAYRNTNYCVSSSGKVFVLRIGVASEAVKEIMAAASASGAVFITAWNPFSKVLTEAENIAANEALKSDLEKVAASILNGYGSSPDTSWREDSFFAFPVERSASIKLCCQYRQNAVIFVSSDGVPELVFHPKTGTP